jgi:hypothetical protein
MKRPRWVVYWSVQDPVAMPPWPLCAGHRETTRRPLPACAGTLVCGTPINLNVERVADGICALAAFGNCRDDPVCCCGNDPENCECIPGLDVCCLDRESL